MILFDGDTVQHLHPEIFKMQQEKAIKLLRAAISITAASGLYLFPARYARNISTYELYDILVLPWRRPV